MDPSFQSVIARKKRKRKKRKKTHAKGSSKRQTFNDTFDSTESAAPPSPLSRWCDTGDSELDFALGRGRTSRPLSPSSIDDFRAPLFDVADLPELNVDDRSAFGQMRSSSSSSATWSAAPSTAQSAAPSSIAPSSTALPTAQSSGTASVLSSAQSSPTRAGGAATSIQAAIRTMVTRHFKTHVAALDLPKQASIPLDRINRTLLNLMLELQRQKAGAKTTATSLRSELKSGMAATSAKCKQDVHESHVTTVSKVCDKVCKRVAAQLRTHSEKTNASIAQLKSELRLAHTKITTLQEEVVQLKTARSELALDDLHSATTGEEEDVDESTGAGEGEDESTGVGEGESTNAGEDVGESTGTNKAVDNTAGDPGRLLVDVFSSYAKCNHKTAHKFLRMCGSFQEALRAYFFCPTFNQGCLNKKPWLFYKCKDIAMLPGTAAPKHTQCSFCGSIYSNGRVRVLGTNSRGNVVGKLYKFPRDIDLWHSMHGCARWFCTTCWDHASYEREHTPYCPANGLVKASILNDKLYKKLYSVSFSKAEEMLASM